MADAFLKQQIIDNTLQREVKDAIYKYVATDALYKSGYDLYFYMNDNAGKEKQIVIQKNGEIVSIEAKKGSIKKTRNKQNIGIPIYMISFI